MLASRRLPAPLMSRAGRGREPSFEGTGAGRTLFFCPGAGFPKVGGRCTHFWWIWWLFAAKSLILEQKCLTKWVDSSTISALSSTISVFCSTTAFSGFTPSFSLFFFYKQRRRRERRHPPNRAFNPPIFRAAYFLGLQIDFAFRSFGGLWWMKFVVFSNSWCAIHQYPPIHQCFPPPPPEEVFS